MNDADKRFHARSPLRPVGELAAFALAALLALRDLLPRSGDRPENTALESEEGGLPADDFRAQAVWPSTLSRGMATHTPTGARAKTEGDGGSR